MRTKRKKVIVFGGLGFLGTHLSDELLKRGYDVTVADLKPKHKNYPFKYIPCDILDKDSVLKAVSGFDFVYNLAGFANLDKSVDAPLETMQQNVIGNLNVLEACRQKKVKCFIYASSAYAMNSKGSFYGISKLTSEKLIEEYHTRFGLSYIILRYGSIYSEKEYDNNYIYHLVKNAVITGKIEHSGDGEEVREYIHVSDAAKLSVDVLEKKEYVNQHIVLTGMEKMKRIDLFRMIKEMLHDKIEIKLKNDGYKHHYKYSPYSFEPTVSKKLVANPYIDLGQGILECIKEVYKNEKK
jgi:UDP-glucose 4-epimerase